MAFTDSKALKITLSIIFVLVGIIISLVGFSQEATTLDYQNVKKQVKLNEDNTAELKTDVAVLKANYEHIKTTLNEVKTGITGINKKLEKK